MRCRELEPRGLIAMICRENTPNRNRLGIGKKHSRFCESVLQKNISFLAINTLKMKHVIHGLKFESYSEIYRLYTLRVCALLKRS